MPPIKTAERIPSDPRVLHIGELLPPPSIATGLPGGLVKRREPKVRGEGSDGGRVGDSDKLHSDGKDHRSPDAQAGLEPQASPENSGLVRTAFLPNLTSELQSARTSPPMSQVGSKCPAKGWSVPLPSRRLEGDAAHVVAGGLDGLVGVRAGGVVPSSAIEGTGAADGVTVGLAGGTLGAAVGCERSRCCRDGERRGGEGGSTASPASLHRQQLCTSNLNSGLPARSGADEHLQDLVAQMHARNIPPQEAEAELSRPPPFPNGLRYRTESSPRGNRSQPPREAQPGSPKSFRAGGKTKPWGCLVFDTS